MFAISQVKQFFLIWFHGNVVTRYVHLQLSVIRSDRMLKLPRAGSILNFHMTIVLCPKTLEHMRVNYTDIHSLNTYNSRFPHLFRSLIRLMHGLKKKYKGVVVEF